MLWAWCQEGRGIRRSPCHPLGDVRTITEGDDYGRIWLRGFGGWSLIPDKGIRKVFKEEAGPERAQRTRRLRNW